MMKYRVVTLAHDCPSIKEGQPAPLWDRGRWVVGLEVLDKAKPKCPYCRKSLYDPVVCNYIETRPMSYYVSQLGKEIEFNALYLSKVDKRRREYRQLSN